MKSKFSPRTLERIVKAWYNKYEHGTGIGKYHFRIRYNYQKNCYGIWRCDNDHLETEIIDTDGNQKTMWEWVEEFPEERFKWRAD